MDKISDKDLMAECLKRFVVIEMITKEEMEYTQEFKLSSDEWNEMKEKINTEFYELIGDDVDEYVHEILRNCRIRTKSLNKDV